VARHALDGALDGERVRLGRASLENVRARKAGRKACELNFFAKALDWGILQSSQLFS
jgi:hypothetical protein